MRFYYQDMESPAGQLFLIANDTHLQAIVFQKQWPTVSKRFDGLTKIQTPLLKKAKQQMQEYFKGKRQTFDLPIELKGTEFQKRVWQALSQIPFGQTRTYKQQAAALKNPHAVRAVGRTNGLNLLCMVLPCHRVIGSDGALTGYAGGLDVKKFLLKLESENKKDEKRIND